jgi:hypothetical protein
MSDRDCSGHRPEQPMDDQIKNASGESVAADRARWRQCSRQKAFVSWLQYAG